jgi:hypothetical protein
VTSESALEAWEDLRLTLLDDNREPTPGHIYGKVTRVTPLTDGRFEVLVSFTSVPAEIYRIFRHDPGPVGAVPSRAYRRIMISHPPLLSFWLPPKKNHPAAPGLTR